MSEIILSVRKLRKTRNEGAGYTLDIEHFDAQRGELAAITGPSGSGKSTALDIFAGILRPDGAERFFFAPGNGAAVDMMDAWRRGRRNALAQMRRGSMGYVLQTGGLLPFLSARGNIMVARRSLGLGWDKEMDDLTQRLGIDGLLDKKPAKLSVGERQRTAIARALAPRPALLLADEPTAALDPVNAQTVMALFTELAREAGSTVILVTHAPETARALGFREYAVRLAREASVGSAEDGGPLSLARADAVRAVLGGAA